ncbi:MAG TPA: hypothetical protein VLM17_10740 [Xanthomonadaceae bacterium]|nr:hypothetical protein [Xanthomonadaceae bacterium]
MRHATLLAPFLRAESRRGLSTGMRASLEFRQMIAMHTDTFAAGPHTAQQLVDAAGK